MHVLQEMSAAAQHRPGEPIDAFNDHYIDFFIWDNLPSHQLVRIKTAWLATTAETLSPVGMTDSRLS